MGPRAGLERCGKSRPPLEFDPDRSARRQSLYQLSYPTHLQLRINFMIKCSTRYPLYRGLGGPQGRSGEVRKISPPLEFDPDRPARRQSLYQLSYPAHLQLRIKN